MLSLTRTQRHGRWLIVGVVLLVLAGLAHSSYVALSEPPRLGVIAQASDRGLLIAWVQPAGAAWVGGIRVGDRVLLVDDRAAGLASPPEAVARATQLVVRTPQGQFRTANVGTDSIGISLWSMFFVAACFAAIGSAVFLLLANRPTAWSILCMSLAANAALVAAPATSAGRPWAFGAVFVGMLCFGLSVFSVCMAFPLNHLATRTGRALLAAAATGTLLLLAGYLWAIYIDSNLYELLRPITAVWLIGELLGACLIANRMLARLRAPVKDGRTMLNTLGVGLVGAVSPFCLLILVPISLGWSPLISPDIAILSVTLLPISLALIVFQGRYRALEYAIRRKMVMLVTWMLVLVLYSVGFSLLDHLAESVPLLAVLSGNLPLQIALIATTFPPLHRWLWRRCEQYLFHDVYSYDDMLQQIITELGLQTAVPSIAAYVTQQIGQTLNLAWVQLQLTHISDEPERHTWSHPPLTDEQTRDLSSRCEQQVALSASGMAVGALLIGPKNHGGDITIQDQKFLATLMPMISTTLQNALLIRQLQHQVTMLAEREQALVALTRKLMLIQEDERSRLALDLHDDPLQRALLLEREISESSTPYSRAWREALEEIVVALRAICIGLRPTVLDDLGLACGIEWLVNDLRTRTDLVVDFSVRHAGRSTFGRLTPDLETALYRVTQEALTNCRKHARASSVTVTLERTDTQVLLEIADDGCGFVFGAAQHMSTTNLGILGMRERLRPWPNTVCVDTRPSYGTIVSVAVDVTEEHPYDTRHAYSRVDY